MIRQCSTYSHLSCSHIETILTCRVYDKTIEVLIATHPVHIFRTILTMVVLIQGAILLMFRAPYYQYYVPVNMLCWHVNVLHVQKTMSMFTMIIYVEKDLICDGNTY